MAAESAPLQELPLPPGDPPSLEQLTALAGEVVRSRGTLYGYDSSTTRAPFAYGLIRGESNELHFFVRAHLERGVIAELLPVGAPLEFFSQKFEPGDVRWAYGIRKVPSKGSLGSRLEKKRRSRSPRRTLQRRWVSLADGVSEEVEVDEEGGVPASQAAEGQASSASKASMPRTKRWMPLTVDPDSVTVEPPEETDETGAESNLDIPGEVENVQF
eukprot:s3107_g4.t1